jgi:hypothetical protein
MTDTPTVACPVCGRGVRVYTTLLAYHLLCPQRVGSPDSCPASYKTRNQAERLGAEWRGRGDGHGTRLLAGR